MKYVVRRAPMFPTKWQVYRLPDPPTSRHQKRPSATTKGPPHPTLEAAEIACAILNITQD